MTKKVYPNGDVPCVCCALPIGPQSPAKRDGGKCFDCSRGYLHGIIEFANEHDAEGHEKNAHVVFDLVTKWMRGDLAPGAYPLPSGTSLDIDGPYEDDKDGE